MSRSSKKVIRIPPPPYTNVIMFMDHKHVSVLHIVLHIDAGRDSDCPFQYKYKY